MEVVIALGLLTMGLATIGVQMQTAYDTSRDTERILRAMHLAQSKLSELDARLIQNLDQAIEDDLEEEFGRLFPDFAWRLRMDPTQTPDLWLVQIHILYQRRLDVEEEEFEFDEAEVVFTLRTMRATPATIDLTEFFPGLGADADGEEGGVDEGLLCLAEALNQAGIDIYDFDPAEVLARPTEELLALALDVSACGFSLPGMTPELMDLVGEVGALDVGTSGSGDESGGR